MPIDRNSTVTVTGALGHALPVRLGDIIDFIVAQVLEELARERPKADEVRPT